MPEEDIAGLLLYLFRIWTVGGVCAGELVFVQRRWTGDAVSGIDADKTALGTIWGSERIYFE